MSKKPVLEDERTIAVENTAVEAQDSDTPDYKTGYFNDGGGGFNIRHSRSNYQKMVISIKNIKRPPRRETS